MYYFFTVLKNNFCSISKQKKKMKNVILIQNFILRILWKKKYNLSTFSKIYIFFLMFALKKRQFLALNIRLDCPAIYYKAIYKYLLSRAAKTAIKTIRFRFIFCVRTLLCDPQPGFMAHEGASRHHFACVCNFQRPIN